MERRGLVTEQGSNCDMMTQALSLHTLVYEFIPPGGTRVPRRMFSEDTNTVSLDTILSAGDVNTKDYAIHIADEAIS